MINVPYLIVWSLDSYFLIKGVWYSQESSLSSIM